jgi:hypothetical protein
MEKVIGTATTKISVCLVKVLALFLWHPILVLTLGILGFVGKSSAPLVRQLVGEMAGGFCPLSLALCAVCYKREH